MFTPEKIDAFNRERLKEVKPELAAKCHQIIALAKAEKYILLVTQGYRSIAAQNALYRVGRRGIPGERRVTNARGGGSNHNFRSAVDFGFIVGGAISWDEKLYQNLGRWTRIVGLKWGGDWRSFRDLPHVEL